MFKQLLCSIVCSTYILTQAMNTLIPIQIALPAGTIRLAVSRQCTFHQLKKELVQRQLLPSINRALYVEYINSTISNKRTLYHPTNNEDSFAELLELCNKPSINIGEYLTLICIDPVTHPNIHRYGVRSIK